LEAFAVGLPVVTTDAGGIPYIVRHDETGLLVPRRDPRALAAAMERVISEPGLARRLSIAAHECLSELYTWPAARDRWLSIYSPSAGHNRDSRHERSRSSSDSSSDAQVAATRAG
jgi:glycosyltransferase involved in cell wall biosynthesis